MTTQETFKRRIRARMAKTGEKYGAARRALLTSTGDQARPSGADGAASGRRRAWIAEPLHTDEVMRTNTGKDWDEWCDIIEAGPGGDAGHSAIVEFLLADHDHLTGWWAQGIVVSYERITGQRVPNQMVDGTFTASKSKTVVIDPDALRALLLDDEGRGDLFPGFDTELRSKPTSKALRIVIGPGSALFTIEPQASGKVRINVSHEKLPSAELVDEWKAYWTDWLSALGEP